MNTLQKITTKCGKQFNKESLSVVAFTLPNFKASSSSYVIYRSIFNEYICCINNYDAQRDYMTVDCTLISEHEALHYVQTSKPQRA